MIEVIGLNLLMGSWLNKTRNIKEGYKMLLRYIKSAMVGLIDLFFSLVAITNLKDFSSNLPAVQHVLSMDTTFHAPALMKRAVTSPYVQLGIYYFIVAWELLTATLCWLGCFRLLFSVNASNA